MNRITIKRARRALAALLFAHIIQFAGCSAFDGYFPERVLTGVVFDSVQEATFVSFFNLGSGAL